MRIAFVTEMGFQGKVPRNTDNCRTEFAWMIALNADHYPITNLCEGYDLVIVIIPKKNIDHWRQNNIIEILKSKNRKIAYMQEGPAKYFQDYTIENQIWFYNTLRDVDILFTHNKLDAEYFKSITGHTDVRVMQSLMILDSIDKTKLVPPINRSNIIIGGNFVQWYGGFDSYIVASSEFDIIYAPSMGRKQSNEENLVRHLPYLPWNKWIYALSEFKYAIHLMPTQAAGTFAMNCAYLGIPCIGYKGLDTQETLHPELCVDINDINSARELLYKLKNDINFYNKQSVACELNFQKYYSEGTFTELYKDLIYDTGMDA
jgi:hypothetical protein